MNEEKAYAVMILAYDLLQNELKNSFESECDLVFEKCKKIADDFLESNYNVNRRGLYDCLVEYVTDEAYKKIEADNTLEIERN